MWSDSGGGIGLRRAAALTGAAAAAAAALAAAATAYKRSSRQAGEQRLSDEPAEDKLQEDGKKAKGIPSSEVALHTGFKSAWIVIRDEVYDITSWLEHHPGGQMLLLAVAGRDATEFFDLVGHSALAKRELRRMRIGTLSSAFSYGEFNAPSKPIARSSRTWGRKATLTGGRKATADSSPDLASMTNSNGCSLPPLWEVDENGFLPARDPVGVEALNGTIFEVFGDLAIKVPAMGVNGELRNLLDTDPELQRRLRDCGDPEAWGHLTEDQLERAHSVVGFTMVMYWRGGTLDFGRGICVNLDAERQALQAAAPVPISPPASQIPDFLAKPMLALSSRLGRPPMIDYASTVLYNWERIDPSGPVSPANIRCVLRMTALLDEEWFFKTHVIIESEAAHAVSAGIAASQSEDDGELLQCLVSLEEALWRVVRACLPIMYERSEFGTPKCSENIFYQVLRPLIKSGTVAFEGSDTPVSLTGPSGAMSSLLPLIDALLGIQTTSPKLREALGMFERSMPVKHRAFLEEMRGRQSIRQRIILTRGVGEEYSEHHDALVGAFNRCIARVLDFRWQHWQYVKQFIMKPGNLYHAVGSGGTTFDYLQQHITDTEQAQLRPRRDVDGEPQLLAVHTPILQMPVQRAAMDRVVQGPSSFWDVDGENGLLSRDPIRGPDEGEWAASLPAGVRSAMRVLWETAKRMPAIVAIDGPFLRHIEEVSEGLRPLQDEQVVFALPEEAREHLMTTLAHISGGCLAVSSRDCRRAPPCIDKPLQIVARSVGRPPSLDQAELVLTNWRVVQTDLSAQAPSSASNAKPGREYIGCAFRFLSTPDEECYRTLHIVLHREARDAVAAVRMGQSAMQQQNDRELIAATGKLSVWLNNICDFFDSYFEQKDSRTESVMIQRLERFISRSYIHDLAWIETACWVYWSGSSVLLPALQQFLGLNILLSTGREQEHSVAAHMEQLLQEMRVSLPAAHLAFLEELERAGVSVRAYCIRRFGAKSVSVEVLHDLEAAFNDTINALLRFLSRRGHLVRRFFPELSSDFANFHADVESYMRRSRLQLLKMRQRVHQALER